MVEVLVTDLVKDGDYNCGFCVNEVRNWDEDSSSKIFLRPCSQCMVPMILEILKEIETDLDNIASALRPPY